MPQTLIRSSLSADSCHPHFHSPPPEEVALARVHAPALASMPGFVRLQAFAATKAGLGRERGAPCSSGCLYTTAESHSRSQIFAGATSGRSAAHSDLQCDCCAGAETVCDAIVQVGAAESRCRDRDGDHRTVTSLRRGAGARQSSFA